MGEIAPILWLIGIVLLCDVRICKGLFYKTFAGSYFLLGSVKSVVLKESGVVKYIMVVSGNKLLG